MTIPPNAMFVRVRHLKNNAGSLYLNDLDTQENRYQNFKIPVYIPYGETIDIPLSDAVLISYKRGSLFSYAQNNLLEAFIFSNRSTVEVENTTSYLAQPDADIILVDTSAHDVTVTLPDMELQPQGRGIVVKKSTADSNQLIIQTQSPSRIDRNSLAIVTTANFGAFELRSAASGWWIVSEYPVPADVAAYKEEIFDITETQTGVTFTLDKIPIAGSEGVYWNGGWLTKGSSRDYLISKNTVELTTDIQLLPGDIVTVHYQYNP